MLGRDDAQVSLFDVANLSPRPLVPKDSVYDRIRQLGTRLIKDDDFAKCYSGIGRPSVSPALLSRVMLLMYLEDASDRQAEENARYDLRWKHALGLPIDEAGFYHTSLCRFRLRLLNHNATHVLFDKILDLARELGILTEEQASRVVDSTPVLGAGAVQNTYTLIRKALLGVKKAVGSRLKGKLDPLFEGKDYSKKAEIDWTDPRARKDHLNELVEESRKVLTVLEAEDLLECERQAVELLAQVTDQDVEVGEDGRVRIRRGVAKDRVISVTDPEMRHGRKSKNKRFDGYKLHVSEEPETELITAVTVSHAGEHDSERLPDLVDDATDLVIGDGAYGTGDMRAKMDQDGIRIVAPQRASGGKGLFTKADFDMDVDKETCRCPAGIEASPVYRRKDGRLGGFRFPRRECRACELKEQCTRSSHRVVNLHEQERYLLQAREYQKTAEFRALYRKRPRVERKIREVTYHGMRQGRYIGKKKLDLQAAMTAAMVNLKRIVRLALNNPHIQAQWHVMAAT